MIPLDNVHICLIKGPNQKSPLRKSISTNLFVSYPSVSDFQKHCFTREMLQVGIENPFYIPIPEDLAYYLTTLVTIKSKETDDMMLLNSNARIEQLELEQRLRFIKSQPKYSIMFDTSYDKFNSSKSYRFLFNAKANLNQLETR